MKIKKSQLKELIKQSIIESDKWWSKLSSAEQAAYIKAHPKSQKAKDAKKKKKPSLGTSIANKFQKQVDKYNKRAKQGKSDDSEFDVGGPAHPNVPKKDDIEKQTMDASKKANKKMEIDVLNKKAEKGNGDLIDTEHHGMVTWDHGYPGEDSFMAIDQDGETVELDYTDIIRFHNDNDEKMKNLQGESKKPVKTTVREVKKWMKGLEENRYKRTYISDARRVSWLVNHLGEDVANMPKSMRKKWTKAQYGREKYLAKEFVKHLQSKQLAEHKVRLAVRNILKEALANSQGEETDFKKGDLVKDINPDCPHHNSEGEVIKGGKKKVTYKVTNNGPNYKEGDELEKTVDQIVKLSQTPFADDHEKTKKQPMGEGLIDGWKNDPWEVYVRDEKGKEKIMKLAKSKRAAVILYNKLAKTDKYHEVGMRVKGYNEVKEGKLNEGKLTTTFYFDQSKYINKIRNILAKYKGGAKAFKFMGNSKPKHMVVGGHKMKMSGKKATMWNGIPNNKVKEAEKFFKSHGLKWLKTQQNFPNMRPIMKVEGKLNEAKKETIFDVAARVVKNKSMEKYKSGRGQVIVDMQSANLLVKVWKKINPKMKKILSDLGYKNPAQLMSTLWAVAKAG